MKSRGSILLTSSTLSKTASVEIMFLIFWFIILATISVSLLINAVINVMKNFRTGLLVFMFFSCCVHQNVCVDEKIILGFHGLIL
ncbi:MAG: hypothetical protein M1371_11945 [Actinobacteria bacterium]|nr:hypothetical protein [Actinomycetota bacterium]